MFRHSRSWAKACLNVQHMGKCTFKRLRNAEKRRAIDCDWEAMFGPGSNVIALPNWLHPRMYLSGSTMSERWARSAFYPAFRLPARLYRVLIRALGAGGFFETRVSGGLEWPVGAFIEEILPSAFTGAVLVGTPGLAQKTIVEVSGQTGEIAAYLKYAIKPAAQERLRRENRVLSSLPPGLGPSVLKFGALAGGMGLLLSPAPGKPVSARLPPPDGVSAFLEKLVTGPDHPVGAHPLIRSIMSEDGGHSVERWVCSLDGRNWPVAIQHGDFAPWNLRVTRQGKVFAFDWEYGALKGFPGFDRAFYLLQVGRLIYRWSPAKALGYVRRHLTRHGRFAMQPREADALARLAAYYAYREEARDGREAENPWQLWWREIWAGKV